MKNSHRSDSNDFDRFLKKSCLFLLGSESYYTPVKFENRIIQIIFTTGVSPLFIEDNVHWPAVVFPNKLQNQTLAIE